MTSEHDKAVLNAIFNPNTPFVIEEEQKPIDNNKNSKCFILISVSLF
jgi:hypothetical protein